MNTNSRIVCRASGVERIGLRTIRGLTAGVFALALGLTVGAAAVCPPLTHWDQSFGGARFEHLSHLIAAPSPAGGFLGVGQTDSVDGHVTTTYGASDVWLARFATNGTLAWERS